MTGVAGTPPPRGRRVLLRGGLLMTLDEELGQLRGDLLIVDGKIHAVGSRIEDREAETVDASTFLVLPGFVDAHRHTWQTPLRHTGADWDLGRIFIELFAKFGPHYRPEDVFAAALLGRLAALDGGVTTLLDWSHIQNTPDHADEAVRGLREAGGRSIFAHGQPATDAKRWMAESTLPHPSDIRRVREKLLTTDEGLITMAMAARGPEFSTMDVVEHDIRLARELGLRVTIHIGLGNNGPKYRGIERMHQRGLLGPDLTFVHCCTSGDHELKLLADSGSTASVSAQIAMACRGFGVPATGRLLAHGVRPSLSVDSEMAASGDMFAEMRAALGMERAILNNTLQERPAHGAITALDVLRFATLEGARAVGLGARIGSLTPGKSADLILIRADALNLAPIADPVGAVVLGGHAGNIEAVFVEGAPVKWGGKLIATDAGKALRLAEQSREYLDKAVAKSAGA